MKSEEDYIIIIQTIGSILIIGSMSSSVLIASLVFLPLVVTSLSITSAIMSGLSIKMNFFGRKVRKFPSFWTKLNQLQMKLDYVVSCNGDLKEVEYQSILRDFDYWIHRIHQALIYEPSVRNWHFYDFIEWENLKVCETANSWVNSIYQ